MVSCIVGRSGRARPKVQQTPLDTADGVDRRFAIFYTLGDSPTTLTLEPERARCHAQRPQRLHRFLEGLPFVETSRREGRANSPMSMQRSSS